LSLLQVENLVTTFSTERGKFRAVDNLSLSIGKGEAVGLVGESGCGKSVTGLSIMKLVATPPGNIESGKILIDGDNLLDMSERAMLQIRGNRVAMIFQEPMTSLNPVFTIGNQIAEAVKQHQNVNNKEALKRAIEMLDVVGVPQPNERINSYPHELSGGLRQRAMIAMALSCRPDLLIADEPTTALDVTIQAQILDLLRKLQNEYGMSILMISHNLGVIAEITSKVVVMYAGRVVEMAPIEELFADPLHPYTKGLYASLPSVARANGQDELNSIVGVVPDPFHQPSGCRFRDRCPMVTNECGETEPELVELKPGRFVRCIHAK
jgi:oligopeptide/dipeptide ABC transporter ATP-binding protein